MTARPPSGLAVAETWPAIASTRPRTTLRPMPRPRREPSVRGGTPLEALEQRAEALGRDARPAVLDDETDRSLPSACRSGSDSVASARRVRGDVVEQVGDDDVEQDGVREDRRQVVRDRRCEIGRSPSAGRSRSTTGSTIAHSS